jgi:Spy/CpxP family protein refolding chaperone
MRTTLRLSALLLALAAPALGAQDHAAHEKAKAHAAKPTLDAELKQHFEGIALTDAQVAQLVAIKEKHHAAMAKMKAEAKEPADPAMQAAHAKHMEAEHAEFKAVLTAEQYARFEANMKRHHAGMAKEKGEHAGHDMDAMGAKKVPATKKP